VLRELLGRGAMGQVFRGSVRGSGAVVAVKVLKPELVSDPEVVARFFQERSILTSVDHPNVAKVLDLVIEGDTLGIVMELVEGGDLRHYLRIRRTLPPAEAVRLACQLLQGLAAVHAAAIVHRDVKPENVLISTARGQADLKLTDFGVSRLSYGASLTKMTSLIGTPEYMAPELADHDSATPAADLYSAGVVLYEMLAGRTPFAGGHPLAVLRRQVEQPPPPIPGAPAELWAQIESLLAKDPRSRPGSAVVALDRLAPLQARMNRQPALPPMPDPLPPTPGQILPGRESGQIITGQERGKTVTGPGSGQTVLRARDRGQGPARENGSGPNAPGRGGHARIPARGQRRAAVLALPAALVILAAAVGFLVIRSPHRESPASASQTKATTSYSFGPQRYQNGLLIVRRWTLSGRDGSLLTEAITASSATGKAARVKLEEPIPAAIASSVQSVHFRPAPSRIIRADPLVEWDLALPAHGTIDVSYQATVGPAGATRARLAQWAKEFDALVVSLNLPRPVSIGVRSLSISPAALQLGRGASRPLTLKGLLSHGQAASHSLLAGAAWSTTNTAVAVVKTGGAVLGVGPGTAVVTAQLGTARASAVVTVTRTSNLAGGDTNSTAPSVPSSRGRGGGPSSSSPGGGGATAPSPSPRPCTPRIATVGAFEAAGTQTVYITGSCFGTGNTSSAADTTSFEITDLTKGWSGCWTDGPGDLVTCNIFSWTGSEISFSGFTGYYGQGGWVVSNGDDIEVKVWNAQSGKGPATCQVVVGSGSPTSC
jgi:tRNA A-37 threonylcarbamoyl transferase component Bud32